MSHEFSAALAAEIASLESALTQDVRYVRLRELRRISALYVSDPVSTARSDQSVASGTARDRPVVRQPSANRVLALAEARAFVENAGRMVPTREVLDHLIAKGIEIGGASPLNNLSAIISTSGVFQPHGRSGWTIRATGGDEDPRDHDLMHDGSIVQMANEAPAPKQGGGEDA